MLHSKFVGNHVPTVKNCYQRFLYLFHYYELSEIPYFGARFSIFLLKIILNEGN